MITKYGVFHYCFKDENNKYYAFENITEAIKNAKKLSKKQPDHEFQLFGISEIFVKNGKTSIF